MKKSIIICLVTLAALTGCKKQLDVKNPNEPTPEASTTENGILALAQGGTYVNGFKNLKYGDGVFGLYWSGAMGFHELLGDVIGAEAANAFLNQIGCPDKITLDNGSTLLNPNNPNKWTTFLRTINQNDQQGSNFIYYEWAYMYNMINAANTILSLADKVEFTGDKAAKLATLQAWCHFWKGYAYSRIGSIYYAGIINDAPAATNNNYVAKEAIIGEANKQLDNAIADLGKVASSPSDYYAVLGSLIPSFCQVGLGQPMSAAMWKRTINTLKARNILVNKQVTAMAPGDWQAVLTLTNDGVQAGDFILTGRNNPTGDFIPASSGTITSRIQSTNPGGGGYKLSERWVQDFRTGDQRYANNIKTGATWIGNSDRGNAFNTRFTLANGGLGLSGVHVYANTAPGGYELPLSSTYEENELMKAEATMYANGFSAASISTAMGLVDNVRNRMGAGLAPVKDVVTTQAGALEELRRERRIALAFRGLSFYDARRWKISESGVGRPGSIVITTAGVVNTNATIDYGYLDYWDVPDNELAYNPPSSGSAPVKNPKQ